LVDVCSPWWSGVAALAVVAVAERSIAAKRAVVGYSILLAVLLLVPLPGPGTLKVLILALPPAAAALVDWPARRTPSDAARPDVRPGAVAAG
jgi:hypothetical protein